MLVCVSSIGTVPTNLAWHLKATTALSTVPPSSTKSDLESNKASPHTLVYYTAQHVHIQLHVYVPARWMYYKTSLMASLSVSRHNHSFINIYYPLTSSRSHQDFEGQRLSEVFSTNILVISGVCSSSLCFLHFPHGALPTKGIGRDCRCWGG